ncbi:MAG: choice-of-anchor D domain-containing protein, partial [Candidatus Parabeggiatoa sp.]|nr:choice-of-anchor D domain-containing protein [Candidatus Parabeggiatoa sp.]
MMGRGAWAETDCTAVTEIPQAECEALVALYDSTDGANWTINTDWNVTNTPCSWYGVTCSSGGGNVEILWLTENQLTGTIPTELGNLVNLTVLDLSYNQLTGTIPTKLSNLVNLMGLDLSYNQLTGIIPDLSNLTALIDTGIGNTRLGYNQLTGETAGSATAKDPDWAATQISCTASPPDMIAWYPFDETSGTTAHDIVGGYDGVLENSPVSVTGKVDGALSFSSDQHVAIDNLPADALYYKRGDFSIDFWVDGNEIYLINYKRLDTVQSQGGCGWSIGFRNDGGGITFCDNWLCYVLPEECDGTDEWNHIALTVNTSGKRIFYINGQQCGTNNFTDEFGNNQCGTYSTPHLTIADNFGSSVDELQIFDRILTPEEVKATYDAGSAGTCGKTLIGGNIWHDHLTLGEKNTGEPSLQGITVQYANSTSGILTTQTDANGNYAIPDLTPGRYIIGITGTATGTRITKPQTPYYDINLNAGQKLTTLDFGIRLPASITGKVWNDINCDGVDNDNSDLPSWEVVFWEKDNPEMRFIEYTDEDGRYTFQDYYFDGQYYLDIIDVKKDTMLKQSIPTSPNLYDVTMEPYIFIEDKDFGFCPPKAIKTGTNFCIQDKSTGVNYSWKIETEDGIFYENLDAPGILPVGSNNTVLANKLAMEIFVKLGMATFPTGDPATTGCFAFSGVEKLWVGEPNNPDCEVTDENSCTYNPTIRLVKSSPDTTLSVSQTSHDVDGTSGTITFDVANTGTGTGPMGWVAEADDSWLTIESGDYGENNGTITVRYDVNSGEERTGTITVVAPGAKNGSQVITVNQAAVSSIPKISVTPTFHNFGNVGIGSSVTKTFTVSNTGTGELSIGTMTMMNSLDFIVQNDTCSNQIVTSDNTCVIEVDFSPQSPGSSKAFSLSILSNDPAKPSLSLYMYGSGVRMPEVSANITSINFKNVEAGSSSTKQSLNISNTGLGHLQIGTVTLTNSTDFTLQSDTCSNQTIVPDNACTINVAFLPKSVGTKNTMLSIPSNAPNSPFDVPLGGTGDTPTFDLTVNKIGTGEGTITLEEDNGINCGDDCSDPYDQNSTVTLVAESTHEYTSVEWSEPSCTTGEMICEITMDADKTVTVTFNLIPKIFVFGIGNNFQNGDTFDLGIGSVQSGVG